MSDYLARLAAAAPSRDGGLAPALRSRSPIAEFDQRLALPGFDALAGVDGDLEAQRPSAPDLAVPGDPVTSAAASGTLRPPEPGAPAPPSRAAVTTRAPPGLVQRRDLAAPPKAPPTSAPPSPGEARATPAPPTVAPETTAPTRPTPPSPAVASARAPAGPVPGEDPGRG